jgi:hypothetical protein
MKKEKLDLKAPHLLGKYFEVSEDGTEFSMPPRDYLIVDIKESSDDLSLLACSSAGCNNQVKITEEGNANYAWYYLTNRGSKNAGVTIEKRWIYQGRWSTETARYSLYPGQHVEAFSFPRNQNPMCCIINCTIE